MDPGTEILARSEEGSSAFDDCEEQIYARRKVRRMHHADAGGLGDTPHVGHVIVPPRSPDDDVEATSDETLYVVRSGGGNREIKGDNSTVESRGIDPGPRASIREGDAGDDVAALGQSEGVDRTAHAAVTDESNRKIVAIRHETARVYQIEPKAPWTRSSALPSGRLGAAATA